MDDYDSPYFKEKIFSIAYETKLAPKTKLNRMFDQAFYFYTNESGGCFFANTILETAHIEPTFLKQLKEFFNEWETALCHIFESKYKPKESKSYARQIISDVEGSLVLMQLYKEPEYLHQALKRAKALL